jgi:Na+/H+-dicarboxylate symporter
MLIRLFKSLPFQLITCILIAFVAGDFLSFRTVHWLFTVSCILKEILMLVLPLVIFSYISAAILSMQQRAPLLIFSILCLVVVSNALATFVSYGVGIAFLPLIAIEQGVNLSHTASEMPPLFSLNFPQWVSPDKAMLFGICFGIVFSFFKVPSMFRLVDKLQKSVTVFFEKGFVPFLPLYVFGFVLKMQHEGSLKVLLKNYGQIFGLVCLLLFFYVVLMYLVASRFHMEHFRQSLHRMIPAGLTGFSTVSSAVSMPVTLAATEKNVGNTQFARLAIPATVNIHMMGHGLSIPIMSLAILTLFGHPLPSLESFAVFVGYFCIAKFSATAVPGGGIIVILPILQSHLGFTPEMAGLMIMLDILQDPILTIANVMGNGAFAMLSYRFCHWFRLVAA